MPEPLICELCEDPLLESEQACGCNVCGRLYGPCCSSQCEGFCIECVPADGEASDTEKGAIS